MSGRTKLKSYFLTGSSPRESDFADLIDSVIIGEEDLTDSLSTESSQKALTATAGKNLNDSIISLGSRVTTLEGADTSFASGYYTKSQVDSRISTIDQVFANLTYGTDITSLEGDLASLQSQLGTLANSTHTHSIAEITSLQSTLNTKATVAYVDGVASDLASSIAAITISDESGDVLSLQGSIASINATIATLPTQSDLDSKIDSEHTHTVSEITDFYLFENALTSTQDALGNHTHNESDITDLDKYTQSQTDLIVTDHSNLKTNPHGVTKEQVGLSNVENLSVNQIFSQASSTLAKKDALELLDTRYSNHIAAGNPHSITKATVGLSNVPNINFQELLDGHIAADNPHNIDLSNLDVYTKSETNTRIQFYLDQARYEYSPTSADSHGAIGDIAYDTSNLYVKTDSTVWKSLPWVASYNSLADVPSTFAPSTHTHAWSDITGKPTSFGASSIDELTDVQTAGGFPITATSEFTGTLQFDYDTGSRVYGDFKGQYVTSNGAYSAYGHSRVFQVNLNAEGKKDVVAYDDDDIMNTLNDGWSITDRTYESGFVVSFKLTFSGQMSHVPSTGQVLAWNQAHSHWMPMTLDVLGTRTLSLDFANTTVNKDKNIPVPNEGIVTKMQCVLSDTLASTSGFLRFTAYKDTGTMIAQIQIPDGTTAGTVFSATISSPLIDGDSFIKVNCDGGADSHVDAVLVICIDE